MQPPRCRRAFARYSLFQDGSSARCGTWLNVTIRSRSRCSVCIAAACHVSGSRFLPAAAPVQWPPLWAHSPRGRAAGAPATGGGGAACLACRGSLVPALSSGVRVDRAQRASQARASVSDHGRRTGHPLARQDRAQLPVDSRCPAVTATTTFRLSLQPATIACSAAPSRPRPALTSMPSARRETTSRVSIRWARQAYDLTSRSFLAGPPWGLRHERYPPPGRVVLSRSHLRPARAGTAPAAGRLPP